MNETKLTVTQTTYVRPARTVVHHIKAWRKYRGYSVHDLAAKASISASMISHLEQGKAGYTQNTLEALAKALDLQPWQLLAGKPNEDRDLWRSAFFQSVHGSIWDAFDEKEKPIFVEMLSNNCNAAVGAALQTASVMFNKPLTGGTSKPVQRD